MPKPGQMSKNGQRETRESGRGANRAAGPTSVGRGIRLSQMNASVGSSECGANRPREREERTYCSASTQTDAPYVIESRTKLQPSLWERYLEANRRRPLLTKSLTTGVLTLVGNMSAQYIMIRKGKQLSIMYRKVIELRSLNGFHTYSNTRLFLYAACRFCGIWYSRQVRFIPPVARFLTIHMAY